MGLHAAPSHDRLETVLPDELHDLRTESNMRQDKAAARNALVIVGTIVVLAVIVAIIANTLA